MRAPLIAVALAVMACKEAGPPVQVGMPAPAYRGVTLSGDSTSLAALRGKVVLINIWATWCDPCREELPILQKLHVRRAAEGLELIGVTVDAQGQERKIADFVAEYGLTYPIWHDPTERIAATFFAIGVPASYLIGRDGTLLWRKNGPIRENDPTLGRLLDSALALPRAN